MFSVAKEKIKPIIAVEISENQEIVGSSIKNIKEPFLFLKKQDKLFAYAIMNTPLLEKLERQNFELAVLLEHTKSIENVCYLGEHISLPVLFQIVGEPFAIIRGEDGIPSGYILREDILAELFKQENKSV